MKHRSRLVKGSFWIFTSQIATKLLSFLYTIIIARLLTEDQIGSFYFVLSILSIFYLFSDFGLVSSLSRYVPYLSAREEIGKLKKTIKLGYFGGITSTFLFFIIVFLIAGPLSDLLGNPAVKPILEMMSIWLFLKEIDDLNHIVLFGRDKIRETQFLTVSQALLKLVLTVIAFYTFGFSVESLSISFILSFLLVIPFGFYFIFLELKGWKKLKVEKDVPGFFSLTKELVSFGMVMTMVGFLWTLVQSIDKIMIGYFLTDTIGDVAVYTFAISLANLTLIFASAISGMFFPIVSGLYGKGEINELNKTIAVSMKWTIMSSIPIILMMFLFGGDLLNLFYGPVYKKGSLVLTLFVFGLSIQAVFFFLNSVFAAMRRLDIELKIALAVTISNLLLNAIFIPKFGIDGAAIASLIAFLVGSLLAWYYSKKILNFKFPKEIFKPLIAGLFAFFILFFLYGPILSVIDKIVFNIQIGSSQGQLLDEVAQKATKLVLFLLLFAFSALVYFFTLLVLKSFGEDEITILEAGLRRAKVPAKYIIFVRQFLEANYLPFHKK